MYPPRVFRPGSCIQITKGVFYPAREFDASSEEMKITYNHVWIKTKRDSEISKDEAILTLSEVFNTCLWKPGWRLKAGGWIKQQSQDAVLTVAFALLFSVQAMLFLCIPTRIWLTSPCTVVHGPISPHPKPFQDLKEAPLLLYSILQSCFIFFIQGSNYPLKY